MKIFTGEQPENPNRKYDITDGCQELSEEWYQFNEGQLSILNQCVEVGDIDDMLAKYRAYQIHEAKKIEDQHLKNDELFTALEAIIPFSQFIQAQIKKQEGKE